MIKTLSSEYVFDQLTSFSRDHEQTNTLNDSPPQELISPYAGP